MCVGILPNRTSAQAGKRPSVCRVERLQQCIQFDKSIFFLAFIIFPLEGET